MRQWMGRVLLALAAALAGGGTTSAQSFYGGINPNASATPSQAVARPGRLQGSGIPLWQYLPSVSRISNSVPIGFSRFSSDPHTNPKGYLQQFGYSRPARGQ